MRRETLEKILDLLGPDEEASAIEYRELHQRLTQFFEWNSAEDPAALADEAIDRLARRALDAGAGETLQNPSAFALGIARLLLKEEARRQQKKIEAIRYWERRAATSASDAETMDGALAHCLAKMQVERRSLIQRYYAFVGGEKAKLHQRLAGELGITANALRNRALRARQELEDCMRKFLAKNIQ